MAAQRLIGYRRPDGRVGIRNHVVLLPVDDLSNAACEAIARVVPGVIALPHAYGRLQFGEDLDLTFRTLIGTCTNPNVAATIVIGIYVFIGNSGVISFGQISFVAVGAFTAGIYTTPVTTRQTTMRYLFGFLARPVLSNVESILLTLSDGTLYGVIARERAEAFLAPRRQ